MLIVNGSCTSAHHMLDTERYLSLPTIHINLAASLCTKNSLYTSVTQCHSTAQCELTRVEMGRGMLLHARPDTFNPLQ